MNETLKRFYTSVVTITFSLVMLYYNIYSMCLYFSLITFFCLHEYHTHLNNHSHNSHHLFISILIYLGVLSSILNILPYKYLILIVPTLMSLFSIELFTGRNGWNNIGTMLIGMLWICAPMIMTILLSLHSEKYNYDPKLVIGIMLLVFFNDAGGYFVGRTLGNHKLFPLISPKKTWEGSIGGAVFSTIVYFPIRYYYTFITYENWTVILIFSIVFGSIGDLIESMFKRSLNIKDTGNVLPGMGGVLDRMDSFLYTIPFVYTYLIMIK